MKLCINKTCFFIIYERNYFFAISDIKQNNTTDLAQHPHVHHATTRYSTVIPTTTKIHTPLSTFNSKTSITSTPTKSNKTYFTTSFIPMTSQTETSSAPNPSTSVPSNNSTYLQNSHITSTRSSNTGM